MNINHICMKCMTGKINEDGKCANCGALRDEEKNGSIHLPVRTILKGKYLVGRVIGEGGFGITYIGYDLDLEIRVAIKEFCPKHSMGRETEDGLTLYPYNESAAEDFEREKEKFINEARRLAKFRNEGGVVSVLDYFIENGTAYIVMDYIDGITLKSYLKTLRDTTGRSMNMAGVLNLFKPVMETLAKIHKSGIIHRDISPENIMLSKDFTKVYLIDFGTARDMESGHTLSQYSKGFYTPIEQMNNQKREKLKQGPWTDVYALCATIYVCITGRVMSDSVSRLFEDDIIMPSKFGVDISPVIESVLMKGLAVKPEDRIQSMEELMQAFYGVQISMENVTQKPAADTNVAAKAPKPVVNTVAQVSDNNMQRMDLNNSNYAIEKQKAKDDMMKWRKVKNISGNGFLIGLIISIIMIPLALIYDDAICGIIGTVAVWFLVLIMILWTIMLIKKKSIFLTRRLSVGKILLQIDTIKGFLVWDEYFFSSNILNQDNYKAGYLKYKNKPKHQYNQFVDQEMFKTVFYRYELLDYYHKIVLPSSIPEELKEEWKQAAIDKFIIIE